MSAVVASSRTGVLKTGALAHPFVVLLIMAVIHNRVFDNFATPTQMLVVFGLIFCMLLALGFGLRSVASSAQRQTLLYLESELNKLKHEETRPEFKSLQAVVGEIEKRRKDVYGHIMANPVLRAALIPGAGIAMLQIAEALSRAQ